MAVSVDRYMGPEFRYAFLSGPDVVRSIEHALEHGNNCVALVHLAIKEYFGYDLPSDLHCAELYQDSRHFEKLDDLAELEFGDLVWFGVKNPSISPAEFVPVYEDGRLVNWREFPIKHVGINVSQGSEGEPEILHATFVEGTNTVWPLSKFGHYPKYSQTYGASRLIQQAGFKAK